VLLLVVLLLVLLLLGVVPLPLLVVLPPLVLRVRSRRAFAVVLFLRTMEYYPLLCP
jgi:hypothetical protein